MTVLKDASMLYRTLDMGIQVLIENFNDVESGNMEVALD